MKKIKVIIKGHRNVRNDNVVCIDLLNYLNKNISYAKIKVIKKITKMLEMTV